MSAAPHRSSDFFEQIIRRLEAERDTLTAENAELRVVCDAAYSLVRTDDEGADARWQSLTQALDDARFAPREEGKQP